MPGGEPSLTPTEAHIVYEQAAEQYIKWHPEATRPPREPVIGFGTEEEICIAADVAPEEAKTAHCAIAITGGEYALYPITVKGVSVDSMFDETWDYKAPLGQSIVFHEFWHYMQFWNKGPIKDSPTLECYEHEAYEAQAVYLRAHHHEEVMRQIMLIAARHPCQQP